MEDYGEVQHTIMEKYHIKVEDHLIETKSKQSNNLRILVRLFYLAKGVKSHETF